MTSSNSRPPSASVCGPNATIASRMSSLKSGSRNSTWYLPIGPSWLKIDLAVPEPAHHLREVLHLRGRHRGHPERVVHRGDAAADAEGEAAAATAGAWWWPTIR